MFSVQLANLLTCRQSKAKKWIEEKGEMVIGNGPAIGRGHAEG